MHSCVGAVGGVLAGWGLILVWHAQKGGMPEPLTNGLAYAGLTIIAMALIGRCAANKWHPALKRVYALIALAMLAGLDVALSGVHGETGQKTFFAALLGIALVILVGRHAPAGLRRRWLGE